MLFGRDEVTARFDDLLSAAQGGRSQTLVLRGEPGIGKTVLLDDLTLRAAALGFNVCRARGISAESELGFACLADLLRSCSRTIEELPDPQAVAIRSALALGPPMQTAPFVVAAATLSVLAAHSRNVPLLVAVDDIQWVDAASFQALAFAARRLQADRVAIVFTCRPADATAREHGARVRANPFEGMDVLDLSGLDAGAAARLVEECYGDRSPSSTVVAAMHRATGGNPLAMRELPGGLTVGQRAGREPLDDPLPVVPALHAAYLRRVEECSDVVRVALLVAAASADGELSSVLGAMAALAVERDALIEAEEHGLVLINDEHVVFAHPMLRSTAYHAAGSTAQRNAHRALADALTDDIARSAWHRCAATVGPDESVAAALSAAARESSLRGGHLSASRMSQVAAARTPDADGRAIRYADAAINAHLGGDVKSAAELLQQAADCVRSVAIEREIIEGLSILVMLDGRPQQAMEISAGYADRIRVEAPKQAARLYSLASNMALLAGDAHSAFAQADLSEMIALPLGGSVLAVAQAARARTEVIRGNSSEGSRLLDEALPMLEGGAQRGGAFEYAQHGVPLTLCWLERFEDARRLLDARIAVANQYGSPAYLPFPLVVESELAFATHRWDDSQLAALRAAELADQTGQQVHVPRALLLAARVDGWRGNGDACRARVEEALRRPGASMPWASLLAAELLGRVSFVAGDMQQALDLMEPVVAETTRQGCGDPLHTGPLAEVVEALVRLGRRDDASKMADRLFAIAEQSQRTWTLGAAHRCAGLLANSVDELTAAFTVALEWHALSPNLFETARTQLCFGEQLRRRKRRAESRVHLRAARATFERLGATAWAERAGSELGLTAERAASRKDGRLLELTTQERHVAGLVAGGGSNRDVAYQLFISEKTVEYHLGSVFRKLGVRSRTQLAPLLSAELA